jgi:AcrR family transcriptional regulator
MNVSMTKTSPAERSRGRPAGVKSGELHDLLLDIAESLFADQGFAATSVRELADRAGVNPALVHYYFGSKKRLLFAVMDRAVKPLAEGLSSMRQSGDARIEDIAALFFSMAARHPAMPKLMTREVLLSGGETRDVFARDYAPKLGGALPALIAREKQQGRIRKDMDDGAAALMILSLCVFPFVARNLAEPVLGIGFTETGLRDYLKQITALLEGGMKP